MVEQRAQGAGAIGHGGGEAVQEGGNRGPTFSEAEINCFLTIMGDIVPIGPMEWGIEAE
jgi:hypothetical protein